MLVQLRAVLDRYAANGGAYREEVIPDCGHSPLLEHPEEFRALFTQFLRTAGSRQATPAPLAAAPDPTPSTPAAPATDPSAHAAPPRRGLFGGLFGHRRT